ncbi:hypothetical protein FBEOM_7664 [Fusarium beomiforme]|uniref:2EXR domain-containing protein n=1 Tax=Fusarium beomiforme TaxID=44412 RepID=A0A9P5DWT5_9HYPO|nr:hypothetical protein FBEOM_7664 [Fusarium beomiforme]
MEPEPLALSFHGFPNLPVELRLRIWHHSFVPRCVELHARRSHYADDFQHGGVPKWQSRCNNPAALSVNHEARSAAMEYYSVKFPLATGVSYDCAGDSINDPNRVLYINPAVDTVAVLGDLDYSRISRLLTSLRLSDPEGKGLLSFAVSASWTYHEGAGDTIRMLFKHMFPELVQFIVFMYDEKMPPAEWAGGVCVLEDCSHTDYYKRYAMGRGQQMRDGDKWMVIGKKELGVMELTFRHGW